MTLISFVTIICISTIMFFGLKLILFSNAAIFLPLVGRGLPRPFFLWTRIEAVLSALASLSFVSQIVLQTQSGLLAIIFIASGLAWLGYMAHRLWKTAPPNKADVR